MLFLAVGAVVSFEIDQNMTYFFDTNFGPKVLRNPLIFLTENKEKKIATLNLWYENLDLEEIDFMRNLLVNMYNVLKLLGMLYSENVIRQAKMGVHHIIETVARVLYQRSLVHFKNV